MSDREFSPREVYGSRSRSGSRDDRRSRSRERESRRDKKDRSSRSRSLLSSRKRHSGDRERPHPSKCIGVFGLSIATSERELRDFFSKYGRVHDVQVVYDAQTGRSRGFAFVYYEAEESATEAKEKANGLEIDGRKIRVDFSITKRAHTPTPGVYMGRPTRRTNNKRRESGGNGGGGYERRSRRYTRSPSPYRERRGGGGGGRDRYRERDRSYSPRRYY